MGAGANRVTGEEGSTRGSGRAGARRRRDEQRAAVVRRPVLAGAGLVSRRRPARRGAGRAPRGSGSRRRSAGRSTAGRPARSALVAHRHPQQHLALALRIVDRPPAREPLGLSGRTAERGALVEQGDDPAVERVDLVADPRQLQGRLIALGRRGRGRSRCRCPARRAAGSRRASEPLGDRLERDVVAARPLADDRRLCDVVEVVHVAEGLACRRVRQVDLPERPLDAEQGVAQRDRRVGQPAGVDDGDVEVPLVQPVDQCALVVRLEEVDLEAELRGVDSDPIVDLVEALAAVDLGLARPERGSGSAPRARARASCPASAAAAGRPATDPVDRRRDDRPRARRRARPRRPRSAGPSAGGPPRASCRCRSPRAPRRSGRGAGIRRGRRRRGAARSVPPGPAGVTPTATPTRTAARSP